MENIAVILTKDVDGQTKDILFANYLQTYGQAKQEIWYKSKNELFQSKYVGLITNQDCKKYCIIYQLKNKLIKLSVICHDGTEESKNGLLQLLQKLLTTKGYIMEASGAVSWILRKNNVPIIFGKKQIEDALGINSFDCNDYIYINEDWNIGDKNKQYYCRTVKDGCKIYVSHDTLFGLV